MLVLSRKQNQEIIIGDDIKITILKTKGNTVRIGIEAPRDVSVRRGELPKKDNAKTISSTSSKESPESEYTVVFSNYNDTQSPTADVIPFERESQPIRPNRNSDARLPKNNDDAPDSIQFRGQLPQTFHNNRLKEIVGRMTASLASEENADG